MYGNWALYFKRTFTRDVGSKPLSRIVVEEAFGMGKTDRDVAGIASVLEHGLQGEGGGFGGPVMRGMLDDGWVQAID